ncbi:MAG: 16S rRNA (guanine(527)-N(7))-methyltransferase RsmG, partial [Spirochaetaceae bacterium]|nr:16S rRNA (guanine(527)-N(7))-methyltransferase RsmG [Spirochaetaceae bacterium]
HSCPDAAPQEKSKNAMNETPAAEGDILAHGLEALGLASRGAEKDKLETYIRELEKWNPVFGFIGKDEKTTPEAARKTLIVRHILDSLAGLAPLGRLRDPGFSLADIGSGAGLPGIPLAIFLPETPVTLVEPSPRKCAFLRCAAALLGLGHVKVFEGELAIVREKFDAVVFRAFRPLDKRILKKLILITTPRGIIAAYKGKTEKTLTEIAAAREMGLSADTIPLGVPFLGEERQLLIISRK